MDKIGNYKTKFEQYKKLEFLILGMFLNPGSGEEERGMVFTPAFH